MKLHHLLLNVLLGLTLGLAGCTQNRLESDTGAAQSSGSNPPSATETPTTTGETAASPASKNVAADSSTPTAPDSGSPTAGQDAASPSPNPGPTPDAGSPASSQGGSRELVDPKLQQSAQELAKSVFEAISAGDSAGIIKLLLTIEASQEIMGSGYHAIVAPDMQARNKDVINTLIAGVKGKTLKNWRWRPGTLRQTGTRGSVFKVSVPHMQNGVLSMHVEGVYIELGLDQLIHVDGSWKILELSLP